MSEIIILIVSYVKEQQFSKINFFFSNIQLIFYLFIFILFLKCLFLILTSCFDGFKVHLS